MATPKTPEELLSDYGVRATLLFRQFLTAAGVPRDAAAEEFEEALAALAARLAREGQA